MKRELAKVLQALKKQGWSVTMTKGSHWRLQAPSGAIYFTGSTPSDFRGFKNMKADLKRIGAKL